MYKFKLETVLRVRKRIEEQLKLSFAKVLKKRDHEHSRLMKIAEKIKRAKAEIEMKHQNEPVINDLILYSNYLEGLDHTLEAQKRVLRKAEEEVTEQRKKVVEAMKSRKLMENLKEKGFLAYKSRHAKKEQIETNEIAITRHKGMEH